MMSGSMMMLDMRIDLLNEDARCSLSDDVAAKWLLWGCGGGRHLDGYLVHDLSNFSYMVDLSATV